MKNRNSNNNIANGHTDVLARVTHIRHIASLVIVLVFFFVASGVPASAAWLYMADEGSGSVASNNYANTNHGVLTAGAAWTNDVPNPWGGSGFGYSTNRSLAFPSTTNGYVQFDDRMDSSQQTVQFWFKPDSMTTTEFILQAGFPGGGSLETGYRIYKHSSGALRTTVANGSTTTELSTTIPSLDWHHVAYVQDTNHVYLYMDGSLKDDAAIGAYRPANYALRLGARSDTPGLYYHGQVDELKISHLVLSAEDVLYDATHSLSGYTLPAGTLIVVR